MRETPVDDSSSLSQQGRARPVRSGRVFVGCEVLSQRTQTTTMSNAQEQTTAKNMSKDVQIVAYLKADADADKREVMASVTGNDDFLKTEDTQYEHYRMVFNGGEKTISEDEYQYLKDQDLGGVRLIHYTESRANHVKTTGGFRRSFRYDILSDVTMAMPSSDMETRWGRKVMLNDRAVFEVSASGPDKMKMLKHQSEVESGEMFVDDDEKYWTLTIRCEVDGLKPSLYRWFDESVVPDIMQEVAKHDWVERTRVMDCEKEYSESGVCFNL